MSNSGGAGGNLGLLTSILTSEAIQGRSALFSFQAFVVVWLWVMLMVVVIFHFGSEILRSVSILIVSELDLTSSTSKKDAEWQFLARFICLQSELIK